MRSIRLSFRCEIVDDGSIFLNHRPSHSDFLVQCVMIMKDEYFFQLNFASDLFVDFIEVYRSGTNTSQFKDFIRITLDSVRKDVLSRHCLEMLFGLRVESAALGCTTAFPLLAGFIFWYEAYFSAVQSPPPR